MSIRSKPKSDLGRRPYRFEAEQVHRMIEQGIIGRDEDLELWNGIIYTMTKREPHNFAVAQVADAFRDVTPAGYHVREEKSCADGDRSLPEPDVAICRGRRGDYLPDVPPVTALALVVEVNHETSRSDAVVKFRRYARVGVPVYWVVDVVARSVAVHTDPGDGYTETSTYPSGGSVPIVVDGAEVGRVAVASLFGA